MKAPTVQSVFVINWEKQDCHKHQNTFLMHTYLVIKTSEIPVTYSTDTFWKRNIH